MEYSNETQLEIANFMNKAQTKIGELATIHAERIYNTKKVTPSEVQLSEDLSDFMMAIDNFYNDWSEKQIIQYIDLWSNRAELDKIAYVERESTYNININYEILETIFPDEHLDNVTFLSPNLTFLFKQGKQPIVVDISSLISGVGADGVVESGTLNINTGVLTLNRSEGLAPVPIDVSELINVALTYDSLNNRLTLTRANGTQDVHNFDNALKSVSYSSGTKELTFTRQGQLSDVTISLADLSDPEVTGGSFNLNSKVLELTKSDGSSVSIPLNGVLTTNDLVDNLTSSSTARALTANQGRVLNENKADKSAVIKDKVQVGSQNAVNANTERAINTVHLFQQVTLTNNSSITKPVKVRGKFVARRNDATGVWASAGIHLSSPTSGNYASRNRKSLMSDKEAQSETVEVTYETTLGAGASQTYYLSGSSPEDTWWSTSGYLVAETG